MQRTLKGNLKTNQCTAHIYFLTLGTRGFSCMLREFSVLAEGRPIFGHRLRPRAANPREKTSRTERCYLPSPLTFELFIGLHLYANRLEVSNCNHMDRYVKKCPSTHIIHRKNKLEFKIHCVKRNHDRITSQFSIVDVMLQFKLQSILQDLDHWI